MTGLIHIYEGDGKGKTSAGVGLCIRCAGSGRRVLYTQFLKDNRSSELSVLKQLALIDVIPCEHFYGFSFRMNEEEKLAATAGYTKHFQQVIKKAASGQYRLLVLDEIIACYNLGMVDREMLISFLADKPQDLEVVLTGRDPAEELVLCADYVSRIIKIKHPYDQGIAARAGIEY